MAYIVDEAGFLILSVGRELNMSNGDGKFRLVTRSDFDGLVCAVLLRELDVNQFLTRHRIQILVTLC
jgi:hypothetical protein